MGRFGAVRSSDGTEIGYSISGNGPNLVLVHGTSAQRTRWNMALSFLEPHFTVCAVDRRGRGISGDTETYSLELEFDDIAAVCDSLDRPLYLLGHSYGALCALGAALRTTNIDKLVLYEAPMSVTEPGVPPDISERLQEMLDQGDPDGMLVTLFQEVVGVQGEALEQLRNDPSWQDRLKAAHTVPREMAAEIPEPDIFRTITLPTLLVTGSETSSADRAATDIVHSVLPNSQIVVLPGQGHVANTTAPKLFVDSILPFLLGSEESHDS